MPGQSDDLSRRPVVFVSGAAHDFGPLGQSGLESLSRNLGRRLVEEEYVLVSGGGLGIGPAAVLGATAAAVAGSGNGPVSERVRVTDFEQDIADPAVRAQRYASYRQKMIDDAGFAVFLAGNKLIRGAVVESDGMVAEFTMARERGVLPIPIGASGHVAARLWGEVRADPVKVYGDDRALAVLDRIAPGRTDIDDILGAVFELLHLYDGRDA